MATFDPAVHGFHFSNGDIKWKLPGHDKAGYFQGLGGRYFGGLMARAYSNFEGTALCGGMVYAALDYFHNGIPIPGGDKPPDIGTPLHSYIVDRQNSAHKSTDAKFGSIFIPETAPFGRFTEQVDAESVVRAISGGLVPLCLARTMGDGGNAGGHHTLALSCHGTSTLSIEVYDPNFPDKITEIYGDFESGFANYGGKIMSHWTHIFVDDGWSLEVPTAEFEGDWRWCGQCQGLFWNGGASKGACPAGGQHIAAGGKTYQLQRNGGHGEAGWKWCSKCQGLFWAQGGGGDCPANPGSAHDTTNTAAYRMKMNGYAVRMESGWQYCRACRGMYWGGQGTGVCSARSDGHDPSSAAVYYLDY